MGTCGSRFALRNRILAGLDHCLNQRSFVQMPGILVVPPPLMCEEKGVSNGQRVHFDQIKGQNAARTNEGFPYYCFNFEFMRRRMEQSNKRNGVC